MSYLKKFIDGFFIFLGVLVFSCIALISFLWWRPDFLINEKNIKKALAYAPEKLQISWQQLGVSFDPLGWSGKRVQVQSEKFCLSWSDTFSSCAAHIDLQFSFSFKNFIPQLNRVDKLQLELEFLKVKIPATSSSPPKSPLPDLRLPTFASLFPQGLDMQQLGAIKMDLKNIELEQADGTLLQSSVLITHDVQASINTAFQITGVLRPSSGLEMKFQSELNILDPRTLTAKGNFLAGTVDGSGTVAKASAWQLQTPFALVWADHLSLQLQPALNLQKENYNISLDLHWDHDSLLVTTGAYENRRLWTQGRIGFEKCSLESQLEQGRGWPANNQLKCALVIKPKKKIKGLATIETDLQLDVALNTTSQQEVLMAAKLLLTGDNSFLTARIEAQDDLQLDLTQKKILEASKGQLKAFIKVPDFHVWKEVFAKTQLAIPAPLHVLKGEIELQASATLPQWQSSVFGEVELTTRLLGPSKVNPQKLFTTTNVDFTLRGPMMKPSGADITARLTLNDVRLEAPPLQLESPPQIFPDKRFVKKTANRTQPQSNFDLRWKLDIKTETPLRLISNLLPEPVPIALDLTTGSDSLIEGQVQIQAFPFEIFKKKAQVESIHLVYHRGAPAAELEGLVRYANPEVQVRILLLGSTAAPRIEFESDPPLNRQQIISVLLFNKSLDELTEEEVNSTASMSRAMADGAFGLFSLFFLSSTPIQSISYDPVSKAYTARVMLDDRTTLSLGSDFSEGRQFSVRRRLGGAWSIRTELRQEESRPDVVLTLLEWLRRF